MLAHMTCTKQVVYSLVNPFRTKGLGVTLNTKGGSHRPRHKKSYICLFSSSVLFFLFSTLQENRKAAKIRTHLEYFCVIIFENSRRRQLPHTTLEISLPQHQLTSHLKGLVTMVILSVRSMYNDFKYRLWKAGLWLDL